MIVVPGKFVYVGSPRTGSHFIYDVLQAHFEGTIRSKEHHAFIPEVLNAKRMGNNLPVYTVVRDPVPWLFSFYWNSLRKYPDRIVTTTFEEFIESRKPPVDAPYRKAVDFPPGHLVIYRHIADKFFPFEKDFTTLFAELGVTDTHGVQATRLPTDAYLEAQASISQKDRDLVRRYFKQDYRIFDNEMQDTANTAAA